MSCFHELDDIKFLGKLLDSHVSVRVLLGISYGFNNLKVALLDDE